jgi:hypothetical protein
MPLKGADSKALVCQLGAGETAAWNGFVGGIWRFAILLDRLLYNTEYSANE